MCCIISDKLASFCGYVNNHKTKTLCKQRSRHCHYGNRCNRCEQVLEWPRSSKTVLSLTNKLSNKSYQTAIPFQFFMLGLLQVMALAGLNITSGGANGVIPWLLIGTGKLCILLIQLHNGSFHSSYICISTGSYLANIVTHRCLSHINSSRISFTSLIFTYNK